MNDRIDHAAEARKHIDWAHEEQSVEGSWEYSVRDYALIAQAEATLALVEQQQIANLIALANGDTHLSTTAYLQLAVELGISPAEFRPDISAALGIETGAGDE